MSLNPGTATIYDNTVSLQTSSPLMPEISECIAMALMYDGHLFYEDEFPVSHQGHFTGGSFQELYVTHNALILNPTGSFLAGNYNLNSSFFVNLSGHANSFRGVPLNIETTLAKVP